MAKASSTVKSNGVEDTSETVTESAAAEAHDHAPHEHDAAVAAPSLMTTVTTVGVVAVAAAVFEAALLPGLILGVGAMMVPKMLPRISSSVQPLFKGIVRSAYRTGKKARHAVAEAQEQVQDIIAEAKSEPQPNLAA